MRGGGAHLLPHRTGHGPRGDGGGRREKVNIKTFDRYKQVQYTISFGTRPLHVEGLVPRLVLYLFSKPELSANREILGSNISMVAHVLGSGQLLLVVSAAVDQ